MADSQRPPRVLVIAGSDSSGGAGLEADQKVIAAHGCYAMTATTALTAQNTQGVQDVHHTPPAFVQKQIDACIDDIGVDVVKCGMLASAATVQVVADAFRRHRLSPTVVDPVMVSTSGAQLLPPAAISLLREQLIPQTTILTPNIPEAKLLLEDAGLAPRDPVCEADLEHLAHQVLSLGSAFVLLKGGHLPLTADGRIASATSGAASDVVLDILVSREGTPLLLRTPRVHTSSTHGTGCSLASAIACNIARGQSVPAAVGGAGRYIAAALRTAAPLGRGHGPINHFHSLTISPFPRGGFLAWMLSLPDVQPVWASHVHHPFVNALADGTLAPECFKHYLVQDYLYLVQFARANALAGYKASRIEDVASAAQIVLHIQREMEMHLGYCRDEFGLAKDEVESAEEDVACTAYTRYVVDVGMAGDWLALQVAFMPCLLGYGYIGARIMENADGRSVPGSRWWKWVESYAGKEFQDAVREGERLLERAAVGLSEARAQELVKIFVHATKMERGFWDMGLAAAV